jgi:nitrate reductase cytochrome c-type subunit
MKCTRSMIDFLLNWTAFQDYKMKIKDKRIEELEQQNEVLLYQLEKSVAPINIKNKVLKRDKHQCIICSSKDYLQVHHKIYRSKGGSNEMNNLETLCIDCHIEKHKNEPVAKLLMKNKEALIYERNTKGIN